MLYTIAFRTFLVCIIISPTGPVCAQVNGDLILEEIVVTATKRAASLQDVPISVSVMSSEKIDQQGISELEDLAVYMPNVHIAEGGTGTQLFIRGIGSGINYGFEQSVGNFIDGVYFGRGRSARNKFLDLERVEVLKGPQSTLFGKNTIAGAVNITTAKPSEHFEGFLDFSYQTELEATSLSAMVTGPLSKNVNGRLVASQYADNGYVENTFTGGDGPIDENYNIRASLEWQATAQWLLSLKMEVGEYEIRGRQDMISIASPTAISLYRAYGDSSFDADFNYRKSQADFPGRAENDNTETDLVQLTMDYDWNRYSLRSITAHTSYEFDNTLDVDSGPIAFIERSRIESHEQFSQELLLRSPSGENLEYLAGLYYQKNEVENTRKTPIAFQSIPPIESSLLGLINGALGTSLASGDLDASSIGRFQQDTNTLSAFFQLTFNHSDSLRSTFGLRYSAEDKNMVKTLVVTDLDLNPNTQLALIYDAVLGLTANHTLMMDRSEEHWAGNVTVQYDLNPDTLVYLNVVNGFKAGGFDEDNSLGRLAAAEFEDESVLAIEMGAKSTLWGGRARANVAVFRGEYDDVQVSTFDGNASFVVGNAAKSIAQGIEMDFDARLTENLSITGAIAYLDATYESFPDAACNTSQITAAVATTGSRACHQDLSGQPLQFSPEWSMNLGAEYRKNLRANRQFSVGFDINWADDTVIANDLDPNLIQEAYYKLNARMQWGEAEGKWSLAIMGKNLNNEKTFTWGNDVPLGAFGFDHTYFQHINPPRTFELQAKYRF